MKKWVMVMTGLMACGVSAAPVAQEQAEQAVQAYLSRTPSPLGAKVGWRSKHARTFNRKNQNAPLFHVVALEGGGFVVMSADTGVSPIIAIAAGEDIVESEDNPLWVLLNRDLAQRMDALAAQGAQMGFLAAQGSPSPEQQWADLLAVVPVMPALAGLASVTDVRVAPLVESKWNQADYDGGYNPGNSAKWCYNYYTPNNWPCGCTVTAGAQVMRYHQYPTASVSAGTYSCWVNGVSTSLTMKGGVYAWANMPLVPTSSMTATEREAIGKLTYDAGVVSRMSYASDGSGAFNWVMVDGLKNVFGYASGFTHLVYPSSPTPESNTEIRNAMLASLDAGLPAVLGISGSAGGHSVVADGYGYDSGVLYAHLNMGWSGTQDAWYNLAVFDVSTAYHFTLFDDVSYNISPTQAGEYITGRALIGGVALPGSTVTASNTASHATYTATSNAQGIYAIRVPSATANYTVSATNGVLATSSGVTVSIQPSTMCGYYWSGASMYVSSTGVVGNRWGNDLTLTGGAPALTVSPSSQSVGNGAGSFGVTVTANVAWSVSTNAIWLSASPTSGTGNGAFTVSCATNTTTSARSGTVTVSGGGLTQTITVTQAATPVTVTDLQNGVAVAGLSDGAGNWRHYRIAVPPGMLRLLVTISGGTGDADLYVRKNAMPTLSDYDYRPWLLGNNETVSIPSPSSGDYYIAIYAYNAYSGVALKAEYSSTAYVNIARPDDSGDGASWATAKRTLQAGIDAVAAGAAVIVTNGAYAPVTTADKAITIQSVNGAGVTAIDGGGTDRCATLGSSSLHTNTVLTGFTLRSGNAPSGGGSYGGTLNNCVLTNNAATQGGGSCHGILNNCTLRGNTSSASGGGSYGGTLNNCIVWGNSAPSGSNYDSGTFRYSCAAPLPGGTGNIALDPLFADAAGATVRLHPNSPCVMAGNNAYAVGSIDLDGNPRIKNGTVCMGAHEFQATAVGPAPGIPVPVPISWLNAYRPEGMGFEDLARSLGLNGYLLWESHVAGLDPADKASRFQVTNLTVNASSQVTTLDWAPRRPDRTYQVWGKTNLTDSAWHSPTNSRSRFFKVNVGL